MDRKRNFLFGYGERLTQPIPPPGRKMDKVHPYEKEEAVSRLSKKAISLSDKMSQLPMEACPKDEAVGVFTLHPAYVAKSYFPELLFQSTGLRSVGSKATIITPDKSTKAYKHEPLSTVSLFVAGKRDRFKRFAQNLHDRNYDVIPDDIIRIEDIRYFYDGERVRNINKTKKDIKLEIVLHAEYEESDYILSGFKTYVETLDATVDFERRIETNGLCFLPGVASYALIDSIEKFSFLRVLRQMPRLRAFTPLYKGKPRKASIVCTLPEEQALNPKLKVAIFDGGMPNRADTKKWVSRKISGQMADALKEATDHGLAVTSAFLFGPIKKENKIERPYCNVDHYRVIDKDTNATDDLFDVLPRITNVLDRGEHEFVNLSIGPDLPVEDDEVEVWTSVLDEFLSSGKILTTIAVGNNGELDRESGNARIMVPSDCVNAMAVGACDISAQTGWNRASYSCIGPGRSPGIVKPDVVAFGGSEKEPFYVIDPDSTGRALPVCGTSFAAPSVLRMAAGIRTHFGGVLSPLAIKALLINKSANAGHSQEDVGHGKIADDLVDIVTCGEGEVTVVYQGNLEASKFIRARLPIPPTVTGNIRITATLCYSTETDPQDVCSYTCSGIEVIFRPNYRKFDRQPLYAKASPLFSLSKLYKTENELRSDAHKWETVLHSSTTKRRSTLDEPVFDIHYVARSTGGRAKNPRRIPYALILSLSAPSTPDFYDRVQRRYKNQLEPLSPVIEIPIEV